MEEQKVIKRKGATMRLGSYRCEIEENTKVFTAYGETFVEERHRHRFEVNNDFKEELVKAGLVISGVNKDFGAGELLVRAVDNVSFEIKQGEFTAIVGHSGSGKSHLASILKNKTSLEIRFTT